MSLRVVIGVDPGVHGALAVLADGAFDSVHDMPISETAKGTNEVNGAGLAEILRDIITRHAGAYVCAAVEKVGNMPRFGPGGTPIKMGASSMFNFGEGAGVIRGVLQALKIPFERVPPARWKSGMLLTGKPKDYARTMAIQYYPTAAPDLKRKKDSGRADALMIARWATRQDIIETKGASAFADQQIPDDQRLF